MKYIKLIVAGLVMALACTAQQTPVNLIGSPQPPSITNVTLTGVSGSTNYCYWVVAVYAGGKSAPAGPACTASANATLSATNFDTVNWLAPTSPLASVSSFDVLRTTTATVPTGACACAVATGVSSSAVTQTDQANALNAYTVNTATTNGQFYLDNSSVSGAVIPKIAVGGSVVTQFPTMAGALPSVLFCGATSGSANCGNTNGANTTKAYGGVATLASNTATITFNATGGSFTSSSSYTCVANDITTRANPVQMIPSAGNTAVITNTTGATDVINWVCIGF